MKSREEYWGKYYQKHKKAYRNRQKLYYINYLKHGKRVKNGILKFIKCVFCNKELWKRIINKNRKNIFCSIKCSNKSRTQNSNFLLKPEIKTKKETRVGMGDGGKWYQKKVREMKNKIFIRDNVGNIIRIINRKKNPRLFLKWRKENGII